MKYKEWYMKQLLDLGIDSAEQISCKKCGYKLDIMGVDSAKRKIIQPCPRCHEKWRDAKRLQYKPVDRTEGSD